MRVITISVSLFILSLASSPGHAEDSPLPGEDQSAEIRFWMDAMLQHGFTTKEAKDATGWPKETVLKYSRLLDDSTRTPKSGFRVVPYPGGRHPRIGFLEGAIDPHRDTKFSVFLPWKNAGYVVVDLPEAIWFEVDGERNLLYLAHTHIPTYWDKKKIRLERIDWKRPGGDRLAARRKFPNGVEFSTNVIPRKDHVDMEMTLRNGSKKKIAGLRTQICVMLKGAPGFHKQTNDNKILEGRWTAVRDAKEGRWIVTIWERARPWANPSCPCMHSDPVFPDLAPGEESTLRGRLFFYEGKDVKAEVERRRKAGTLEPKPVKADGK